MNQTSNNTNDPREDGPPPGDELDALLRAWHEQTAERAIACKDALMSAIGRQSASGGSTADPLHVVTPVTRGQATATAGPGPSGEARARRWHIIGRILMNRYSPIAACLILAAVLVPVLWPTAEQQARATNIIMAPEGGRLDAVDSEGNIIGPCPLQHTDVKAEVTGRFVRVTLTQKYKNPYPDKIEAVYTFPMSHRAAVDRMKMVVGDRVVLGEVHERRQARAIYEAARRQGYVASLLEQERPNIFTQSVANIEPQAEIDIEISYVELLQSKDGTFTFDFPMVVGPRYIPGSPPTASGQIPDGLTGRRGVILFGPAKLEVGEEGDVSKLNTLQTGKLAALIHAAVPTTSPDPQWWEKSFGDGEAASQDDAGGEDSSPATQPADTGAGAEEKAALWYTFTATYCGGAKEFGELYTNRMGQLNGRWFYFDPAVIKDMGAGFSPDTDQVPDASRITPEPVRPGHRAGHDISVELTIDTGGPGIAELKSDLHDIARVDERNRGDGLPSRVRIALKKEVEIPNRDFVINWRQTADTIEEATFTHTGELGSFFTLMLTPPERVEDDHVVGRELVFVLDSSGSMSGFPIEKAKQVMARAIDSLRPQDTFNLITFSGDTHILWDRPRPFTEANRKKAQEFLASRQGSGGTEMMKAINAALVQTVEGGSQVLSLESLADLPADGRDVTVCFDWRGRQMAKLSLPYSIGQNMNPLAVRLLGRAGSIEMHIPNHELSKETRNDRNISCTTGKWVTRHGHAMLIVDRVEWMEKQPAGPVRIVCFMTDGYVGNDMAIIDAVKKNADTTRVFSFGIGNSVNRFLLEGMARAGRGEVEFVLLESDADQAAERFAKRIQTPVLTDIALEFSDGLKVTSVVPKRVPDLFDAKPLIVHGQYTAPGKGTLTIRGNTGSGPYSRTLDIELPESQPGHDVIATLWARAKVEELMAEDLAAIQQQNYPQELIDEIVRLGERFSIMTQYTSFVAVEKSRITIGGEPKLVAVPIEMPDGVSYEGVFGSACSPAELFTKDKAEDLISVLTPESSPGVVITNVEDLPDGRKQGTLRLKEADAPAVAEALKEVVAKKGSPLEGEPVVISATSQGNLVIVADEDDLPALRELVETLDAPAVSSSNGPAEARQTGRVVERSLSLGDAAGAGSGGHGWTPVRSRGRFLGTDATADRAGTIGGMGMMGGMGGMMGGYGGGGGGYGVFSGAQPGAVQGQGDNYFTYSFRAYNRPVEVDYTPAAIAAPSRAPAMLPLERNKEGEAGRRTGGWRWHADDRKDAGQKLRGIGERYACSLANGHFWFEDSDGDGVVSEGELAAAQALPPFLRERAALAVARLVGDGQLDDARKLADALVKFDAKYEIGTKMRDTLADASLNDAERDKRIAELAKEAARPVEAAMREVKVRSRLDPRLYQLAQNAEARPDGLNVAVADGGIRVTVLVSEVDDKALSALTHAGLKVEGRHRANRLVVGVAPRDKLEDLTLVDQVRRIEPTMMN